MKSEKQDTLTISSDSLDSAELDDVETERQSHREPGNGQPAARDMRKYLRTVLVLVLLLAAACGVLLWVHSRDRESTDDAQIDGHIYPVSARIGGRVASVLVEDGQFVHVGEVLVLIDPSDFQLSLDLAEADYKDS